MKKKKVVEKIEVVIDGVTHTGFRVIEGTTRLKQTIVYEGKGFEDPQRFKAHEKDKNMRGSAILIFGDMITGNLLPHTTFLDIDIDL